MSNICFIPARSTSTRLKNKNITKFGNGNLVTHTIEQARLSSIFSRIILSSNSEEILEMGRQYNIELHLRDDKYDTVIEVMRNAIPELGVEDYDNMAVLFVTCPLRSSDDIIEAYKLFIENDEYHCVVSVKKNENPIHMSFKIDGGGHLKPIFLDRFSRSTRKQDHEETYFFNDAIIIDTISRWIDEDRPHLYGHFPVPYLMPWERSIAIDYEFQLKMARCLEEK